ncbi:centriolar and ciliogenesis-associated protein hyls-1 isoform X3 [Anabrus simplex]|uniref:centriolar and ciliogenesis-associated protein hyls-1 isoform X3 n=1 Tax=Anabrus simplex TaxID=316456 RepID=UPI0035A28EBD
MESKLDPREVLSHLNKMGYRHITTEQLRDFTRDLKKLMKYDQLHCSCPRENKGNGVLYAEVPSEVIRSHSASESASYQSKVGGRLRNVCDEISVPQKQTRPKSAFFSPWRDESVIKPWRLLEPMPQPRSDPVALYHKYQEIWKQQKAPGECSHQGLRWSVREKMLGQDPNPRPMSRNSSQDAVWRRRKLR